MTPYEVEVEVENSLRRMCISTDGVTVEKEGEKDEDENENENEVRRDLTIDSTSRTSTHTFILYLTDCESGGETRLLRKVPGRNFKLTEQENTLAAVQPRAGRLLVFPHSCPHSGAEVTCVPKLLLRGEMI